MKNSEYKTAKTEYLSILKSRKDADRLLDNLGDVLNGVLGGPLESVFGSAIEDCRVVRNDLDYRLVMILVVLS